jgi:hypothetical protein
MKIQYIILVLLLAGGITVGAQTTNTPSHNSDTRSFTLTGHYSLGFHVLDRANGEWPVAANIVVKAARFEEVTNKIDEISGLITNKLAVLKKEDLFDRGSIGAKQINTEMEIEANRLFSGNPIQGFYLWIAIK